MLPSRWWPSMDRHLPVTRAALSSSVLTAVGGGIAAVAGFVAYAQRHAGAVNDAILKSPGAVSGDLSTLTLQTVSAAAAFGFFITPQGIAATYFTVSGTARAVMALFSEGSGDSLLTAVDR